MGRHTRAGLMRCGAVLHAHRL